MTAATRLTFARRTNALLATVLLAGCEPAPPPVDPDSHRADVETWRENRYAELTEPFGEESWLSLVGLHWLAEGSNTFGAASDNDVVFASGSAPATIGTFHVAGDTVRMDVRPGLAVTHDGSSVRSLDMSPRSASALTAARLGSLQWFAMRRNGQMAIRVRDSASPVLTEFDGIDHFAVTPAWHVAARFDRYDPPKPIRVPNVLGTVSDQGSPGAVEFRVAGRKYRLDVTGSPEDDRFWVLFADSTNGFETYGGGRYVWIDAPDERGWTVIDFNRAYNPPCVFTDYATCPLPPRQNRLALRVVAGERKFAP